MYFFILSGITLNLKNNHYYVNGIWLKNVQLVIVREHKKVLKALAYHLILIIVITVVTTSNSLKHALIFHKFSHTTH